VYAQTDENIRVYNLPDLSIAYEFEVSGFGSAFFRLYVSPRDPNLVAIALGFTEIVFYRNGNKLPNSFVTNSFMQYSHLLFSETKNILYIQDRNNNALSSISFDNDGVISNDREQHVLGFFENLKIYDEKIYGLNGVVLDISEDTIKFEGRITHQYSGINANNMHYTGTLIDSARQQIIQAKQFKQFNDLYLYHFDMNTLQLTDPDTIFVPYLDWTYGPGPEIIQFGDGMNFLYITENNLVIVRDCEYTPKPTLDSIYLNTRYHCDYINYIVPPEGYDAIYDIRNLRHDSIPVNWKSSIQFRVMDDNGCLSELSDSLLIINGREPVKPDISVLGTDKFIFTDSITRCQEGKAYFQASGKEDNRHTYHWSNGEIGNLVSVEDDTEISVRIYDESGCFSSPSDTIYITDINKITPTPPLIYGRDLDMNRCNEQYVTLKAESGYTNYSWYNYTEGETREGHSTWIGGTYGDFQIFLQGRSVEGCWSDYSQHHVREFSQSQIPEKPNIERNNIYLSSNTNAISYQWYWEGNLIENSNSPVLSITRLGKYHLRVGNGRCWSSPSNEITIQ